MGDGRRDTDPGLNDVRLSIDIGGTFTDVVLEARAQRHTTKVLTTAAHPEEGFLQGVDAMLTQAQVEPRQVRLIVHGTTLATNTIIERKGAKVALLCTEGFRDTLEMAHENRFEQYDVFMRRPAPLVPRWFRFGVPERVAANGDILLALDEQRVFALAREIEGQEIDAVAVTLMHSYANSSHERRIGEILAEVLPDTVVSLSSEVCPEIREYERMCTTVANAYVQPLMHSYLTTLERELGQRGFQCPLLMIMSSGTITTLETARRFPIRLVESGPAGGTILAAHVAAEYGKDAILSFDMGGTTAKMCFIDDYSPQLSRTFEVAREYRFQKGSGLPLNIPAIEMVEIGAGGGSIASINELGIIAVGPQSAGSEPGPACYGRGGELPTVTDADLALGRIDLASFAGGRMQLDVEAAHRVLSRSIGAPLQLSAVQAASGITEMVDENMANAARIHAAESGKEVGARTMIAFGGAAPLHAARVADKLGIREIIIPSGAGVGSAIGFLQATIAYEFVRTSYMDLRLFDATVVNRMFESLRKDAEEIVRSGAPEAELHETRKAYIRYRGQGYEVAVALPVAEYTQDDREVLSQLFEAQYRALFGRTIPGLTQEAISWSLTLGAADDLPQRVADSSRPVSVRPAETRRVYEPESGREVEFGIYYRTALRAGDYIEGPAIICERETTTVVSSRFSASFNERGHIVLTRKD